jgi:hypothetical protein
MRAVSVALVGCLAGFGAGWLARDSRALHYYELIQPAVLSGYSNGVLGLLPEGTIVEAQDKVAQHSDVASTACLRVVFGSSPVETETYLREIHLQQLRATRVRAASLPDVGLEPGARFGVLGPAEAGTGESR